jgi:hypothetical protein
MHRRTARYYYGIILGNLYVYIVIIGVEEYAGLASLGRKAAILYPVAALYLVAALFGAGSNENKSK